MKRRTRSNEAVILSSAILVAALLPAASVKAQNSAQVDPETEVEARVASTVEDARSVFVDVLNSRHDHVRWAALRAASVLTTPWIAEVTLPITSSPDTLERVMALEAVAATAPEIGRGRFLAALTSPDRAVRLRGLQGLERLGDPSTVHDISKHLDEEGDPDLRAAAARALGAIGDPSAVPSLYGSVSDDSPIVRREAVAALVTIGDEEIGPFLVTQLERTPPLDLPGMLKLLAIIADPAHIPRLARYLDDEDDEVRCWAATAILASTENREPRGR
ncbi:MAG: HEAT repeat domain-containing protein [Holophagae bacterium]